MGDIMPRYIDAEKLVQYAKDHSTHWLNEWDTLGVLAAIGKTPTADVQEVKHGMWMLSGTSDDLLKCSICGFSTGMFTANEFNFCPFCGAKMD